LTNVVERHLEYQKVIGWRKITWQKQKAGRIYKTSLALSLRFELGVVCPAGPAADDARGDAVVPRPRAIPRQLQLRTRCAPKMAKNLPHSCLIQLIQ
jgi:hypothetical protein